MDQELDSPAETYFVFVRHDDGWGILHRADCRFSINRADPNSKHPSGEWAGPYGSRIEAIGAAEKVFGCRVRQCSLCKA